MDCSPDCEGYCRHPHISPPYPPPFQHGDKAPCHCLDTWIAHFDPYEPIGLDDIICDVFQLPETGSTLETANNAAMITLVTELIPSLNEKVVCPQMTSYHTYSIERILESIHGVEYAVLRVERRDVNNFQMILILPMDNTAVGQSQPLTTKMTLQAREGPAYN
ncbi:hypothetical protein PM082_001558 [Marasmius tenuissimus]|nr:hypothetical protein PM082_001558 [Marasmius tenuissimus]